MNDNTVTGNRPHADADHHDASRLTSRVPRTRGSAWKYSAMIVVAAGATLLPLAAYAQSATPSDSSNPSTSDDHSLSAEQNTPKKTTHRMSHKHATHTSTGATTAPAQPDMKGTGNRNLGGSDAGG